MRKLTFSLTMLLCTMTMISAQQSSDNNEVIPGASYYIIKGNETEIFQGIGADNTHITFYDAEGNVLKVLSREECDLFRRKDKLDPFAPKPKVATYAIKWWPAITGRFLWRTIRKGAPGYFIVLKDRHGNYIKSFRCNEKTKKIIVSYDPQEEVDIHDLKDFDVSNCVEQGSDPIYDHFAPKKKKKTKNK